MPSNTSISDDMDQYYVGAAGYSPMERIDEQNSQRFRRAKAISQQLVEIGPPAADAVALASECKAPGNTYCPTFAPTGKSTSFPRRSSWFGSGSATP